jgi:hypothetical protein
VSCRRCRDGEALRGSGLKKSPGFLEFFRVVLSPFQKLGQERLEADA